MWSSTVLVMAENIPITEKFSPEQLDLEEDIEGGLEKITLDLNELSDEEKYSQTMPEKHKCDGCMAIAYTLHTSLQIKHLKNKHIKQYRIPESQLLELFGNFLLYLYFLNFILVIIYCNMHLSIYKFDLHFFSLHDYYILSYRWTLASLLEILGNNYSFIGFRAQKQQPFCSKRPRKMEENFFFEL